jgi:hypothetical protein
MGIGVGDAVEVAVAVGVSVGEGVSVGDGVSVAGGVSLGSGVSLAVGVPVGVGVSVCGVSVGVSEAVAVGVGSWLLALARAVNGKANRLKIILVNTIRCRTVFMGTSPFKYGDNNCWGWLR